MNFVGKSTGGGDGDSGSSSGGSRRQPRQHDGREGGTGGPNSVEEDDDEERQNTGQLHPSSSSSSPSSSHLPQHQKNHYQNQKHQQQHQPFHPYHNLPGGWIQPSASSHVRDTVIVDNYSSLPDDNNNSNNNINKNDKDEQSESEMMMVVERENMFDKVVTPSDVGKLNRLVIPKQHAERYFPLDSSTNDKGLLLNFEDKNGKSWRFRYSYWNSSQSYVMTKGWSRFVKDKKLDAGDIVSFQRGVGGSAKDRLFIDWRHRPDAPVPPYHFSPNHHQFSFGRNNNIYHPWNNYNPLLLQSQRTSLHSNLMVQPSSSSYGYRSTGGGPYHNIGTGSIVNVNQGVSGSVIYFRSGGIPQQHVDMMQMHHQRSTGLGSGIGTGIEIRIGMDPPQLPPPRPPTVFESVPVVQGKAAAKRLRLFGVNMDCPILDDNGQPEYDRDAESPTTTNYQHDQIHYHHHHPPSTPSSSTIPYQQLKPYEEEEETTNSSSSPMSLDLGI